MPTEPRNLPTDIRGASSLTIDGIVGIVNIAESLHATITNANENSDISQPKRTKGITGMVYRTVRNVTQLVGSGIDVPLSQLGSALGEADSSPKREAVLAALNGVVGDHLTNEDNLLATPLQFRQNGIPLEGERLADVVDQSNGRLAIMIHGVCMNDLQWNRQEHNHGTALARDLGYTPLYLNYNSGLHISENGRNLADLLETIADQASQPLEIVILGYSMGGLVARSACHYGALSNHKWLTHLQKIIFLGTPHHGAPMEKSGNWINVVMDISPYSAPFSRLGKIRSCGITDLRYGNVVDTDWQEHDRFESAKDRRTPISLPDGVQCYAIAGTTAKESGGLDGKLIGDGLVPIESALGQHKKAEFTLQFPESHQWVGTGMNHLDLLSHPDVYDTIKGWLTV